MTNNDKVRETVPTAQPTESKAEYIERLVNEAKLWSRFAEEHSNLTKHRLQGIAMDALAFSINHGAKSLAIPSKLVGVMEAQDVLEAIVELGESRVQPLAVEPESGKICVYYGNTRLGWIWAKHGWLWPLLAAGAKVFMTRVTGTDETWKSLGCNVCIAHVAAAIRIVEGGAAPTVVRTEQGDGSAADCDWPAAIPTQARSNGR